MPRLATLLATAAVLLGACSAADDSPDDLGIDDMLGPVPLVDRRTTPGTRA